MSWVRLDDGLHDHPKFVELDDLAAVGLWTLCLTWAARHPRVVDGRQTSGVITTGVVRRLAGERGPELAGKLVANGLWTVLSSGWVAHDAEVYEPAGGVVTQADISRIRSSAGRKGAEARWRGRPEVDGKNGKPMANACGANAVPMASSRPVQSSVETYVSHSPRSTRERGDVARLCARLSARLAGNEVRANAITDEWRESARQLLDDDNRTEEQVGKVIDFSASDDFWKSRCVSMAAIRRNYDKLRMQADEHRRLAVVTDENGHRLSTGEMKMRATLELAERLRAEDERGRGGADVGEGAGLRQALGQ